MKKNIFVSQALFYIIFSVLVGSVTAEEGGRIHIGNLKVIPGLKIQEVYDDNIYLANGTNDSYEAKESDWIFHIKPEVTFDYTFHERGGLKLAYFGDLAYYGEYSSNDWQKHEVLFDLDYKAPGGFIVGINNTYVNTDDPYSTANDYKLGVPLTKRWYNDMAGKVGYEFSRRFRVLAFYNFFKQDYKEEVDFTQDYRVNEVGMGVEVRLLPKTWGFVRYHFGERDYYTHPPGTGVTESNDSDFDSQRVNLGINWDTRAKLSGEVNFGYLWKKYDNVYDSNGDPYEDKDTWIASTFVSYKATDKTGVSLNITRALRESYSDTNEYFTDTGIGITLQQKFMDKFTLTPGVSYSNNDYNKPDNESREDNNYRANIDLDYQIQDWLKAGVGYAYDRKDSNYLEYDYTDNRFMISLSGIY
ncbi:MAG TPA: hypothetical protein DDW42_00620 [Desulfobacteraceae bacterium]|nr:hypothetical protein [Desulfobacteraceae bacterium]